VAVVAVAGLAVGLILALGGDGATPGPVAVSSGASPTVSPTPTIPISPVPPAPPTPSFEFRLLKFAPVRGSTRTRLNVVREVTRRAVHNIRDELGRMYRLAFLDPAGWQQARYAPVFRFFAGDARTSARGHVRLLTLGPDAGRRFERVTVPGGSLKVKVLLDRGGHPVTAVANASFHARATELEGGMVLVRSEASYFLRPSKRGWLIFGFEVRRKDHPVR